MEKSDLQRAWRLKSHYNRNYRSRAEKRWKSSSNDRHAALAFPVRHSDWYRMEKASLVAFRRRSELNPTDVMVADHLNSAGGWKVVWTEEMVRVHLATKPPKDRVRPNFKNVCDSLPADIMRPPDQGSDERVYFVQLLELFQARDWGRLAKHLFSWIEICSRMFKADRDDLCSNAIVWLYEKMPTDIMRADGLRPFDDGIAIRDWAFKCIKHLMSKGVYGKAPKQMEARTNQIDRRSLVVNIENSLPGTRYKRFWRAFWEKRAADSWNETESYEARAWITRTRTVEVDDYWSYSTVRLNREHCVVRLKLAMTIAPVAEAVTPLIDDCSTVSRQHLVLAVIGILNGESQVKLAKQLKLSESTLSAGLKRLAPLILPKLDFETHMIGAQWSPNCWPHLGAQWLTALKRPNHLIPFGEQIYVHCLEGDLLDYGDGRLLLDGKSQFIANSHLAREALNEVRNDVIARLRQGGKRPRAKPYWVIGIPDPQLVPRGLSFGTVAKLLARMVARGARRTSRAA